MTCPNIIGGAANEQSNSSPRREVIRIILRRDGGRAREGVFFFFRSVTETSSFFFRRSSCVQAPEPSASRAGFRARPTATACTSEASGGTEIRDRLPALHFPYTQAC
uniref:Uncharacterized protein n=1 Tax=Brassica oleracea TaxID=3712 RepID=A0A3P6E8X0_BRAOL|nr:unnamed protein product [Brassica oleracea]